MTGTPTQANPAAGQDAQPTSPPPPDAPQDNSPENTGKTPGRGFDLLAYLRNMAAQAWSATAGFTWLKTALLVLVLGMLFKISGSDPMIWWRKIYEPEGWIFVDSPEVYTRERLINERLDEDIWLAARLKEADLDENLTSLKRLITRRLNVGQGKDGQDSTTEPKPGPTDVAGTENTTEEVDLTFDQKVKIKSANRDFILKRIIENRLDDRHDLEGNSLYILKFDTTIITNQVSNRRAMVEVRVSPPVDFPAEDLDLDFGEVPLAIAMTDERSLAFIRRSFLQFIQDTSDRLNNAVAKAYAKGNTSCMQMTRDDCVKKYAALSFGVIEKDIGVQSSKILGKNSDGDDFLVGEEKTIVIEPLDDYIKFSTLVRDGTVTPAYEPSEEAVNFELWSSSCVEKTVRDDGRPTLLSRVPASELTASSGKSASYLGSTDFVALLVLLKDYRVAQGMGRQQLFLLIEKALSQIASEQHSIEAGQSVSKPWGNLQLISFDNKLKRIDSLQKTNEGQNCRAITGNLNIGFLMFAKKVRQYNTYSYSVLPRESVTSAVDEVIESSAIRLGGGKPDSFWESPLNLDASSSRGIKAASLQAKVTSFGYVPRTASMGKNAGEDSREVAVGWIINPKAGRSAILEDDLISTTESVMAIVSVPSWWPYLDICIERHWLSPGGGRTEGETCNPTDAMKSREGAQSTRIRVDLPNTQQIIESSLIGQERRTPRIESISCEWGIAADAESKIRPLRCIVSGKRLWRNTIVTLGTKRHDDLSVMPNMEGLIVTFDKPENQNCAGVTMSVWTSEGMAQKQFGDSEFICRDPSNSNSPPVPQSGSVTEIIQ